MHWRDVISERVDGTEERLVAVWSREKRQTASAAEAAFGGAGLCSRRFYAKILRVRANFLRF